MPSRPHALLRRPVELYRKPLPRSFHAVCTLRGNGHQDAAGNWQQLNTNVLQIENSTTRTFAQARHRHRRTPAAGPARPRHQYIEVRCLDINPFLPLGIDLNEARFLDAFLLFCALADSPCLADGECGAATDNFLKVVRRADAPGCSCSTAARPSRSASGPASCSTRSPKSPPCSTAAMATAGMPRHWPNNAPRSPTAA